MQLAPMRYTKIEGTAVAVSVTSAAQAKAALKELRHKKRELKFLRTALVRRQRAARTKQSSASKPRRSLVRRFFAGVGWLIMSLFEVATVARAERRARSRGDRAGAAAQLDETLHNIEGCTLQLQGKMLTLG